MLISSCLRADGEYRQLRSDLSKAFRDRSLPFAASGLCEGACDALMLALLEDLKQERKGAALCLVSEEKECVRLQELFEQNGLRVAFFVARDLTFYTMTASHEYEHERLRVLSGLCKNDFDVVLTTPDAALGYTVSRERLQQNTLHLDNESILDPTAFSRRLTAAGYSRVDLVEGVGG